MKNLKLEFKISIVSIILMAIGMLFYYHISNYIMAMLLMIEAITFFVLFQRKYNTFINVCGIFSGIWFFTIGLATLQLHQLQEDWKITTFIYLELAYILFILGYSICIKSEIKATQKKTISKKDMLIVIFILTIAVIIGFILEVIIRGYIPVFSNDMSSYMNFSVTGIHYFTVSSPLILPIIYLYMKNFKTSKKEKILLLVLGIISVLIPILIVSRELMILTIILTFFTVMYFNRKKEFKLLLVTAIIIIIGWGFIGSFRNQDDEYLKQALQIQDDAILSVGNMQKYMYITFNYDNFNANVGQMEKHSYGGRAFFPVLALSGIKFMLPDFWEVNLIRVIDVYNTYPIVMTPYSDFGGIGIFIYMFLIGVVCRKIDGLSDGNPINIIIKMLIKYSIIFSFFACFFSSPTIWFYVIVLLVLKRAFLNNKILKIESEKEEV